MEAELRKVIEIKYDEITPNGLKRNEWYYFPVRKLLFHKVGNRISRWEGDASVDKYKQEFGYGKASK